MVPKRIELIERLGTSTNGNPRYRLVLSDHGDDCEIAITQSDAAVNYDIGNPGYRVGDLVEVQFTRAGRVARMSAV